MIEKTPDAYRPYQKKITSYLDGSLGLTERAEFEAFVATHPDFKEQISHKENEIQRLRSLIPNISLSPRIAEDLGIEIKQSVFNLLKREPKNFWENLKDRYEEWLSNR